MKTIVIKWWRVAVLGAGLAASTHADEGAEWRATVTGRDIRFDPTRLELKPVPITNLVVRPEAVIRKLLEGAGSSIGLADRALQISPSRAGATGDTNRFVAGPVAPRPTNRTVSVICVSGCAGLFRGAGSEAQHDAS